MSSTIADGMTGRLQGFRQGGILVWLIGLLAFVPIFYLFFRGNYNLLIGLIAMGTIVIAWRTSKTISLVILFTFLLVLGDLRRIVNLISGPSTLDPLLLVGPLFTIYVTTPLLMRLKLSDNLSKAILGLLAVMTLQIFNPSQGPVIVGLSGALFWIVPVLWFWIGRWLVTEQMLFTLFYRVFFPLGLIDAILGLFQTYFGYLPWEEAWAKPLIGQYVLGGGQIRPFGFSSSAVEYAMTIMIATVLAVAAIVAGRRLYVFALPILLPASLLSSSRGIFFKTLFAVAMIWAIRDGRGRQWIPRLIFALCVGTSLMIYSAATVAPQESLAAISQNSSSAEFATAHVTQGLAHPFDDRYSTGGFHLAMIWFGIVRGFNYPIGTGIGAVTLGASKFGGDAKISGSTEVDISDSFVSMGILGGLLYLFIIYRASSVALGYVRTGPKILSLACIGILAAMLGTWIPPSYCIGPLIWLFIGSLIKNQFNRTSIGSSGRGIQQSLPAF